MENRSNVASNSDGAKPAVAGKITQPAVPNKANAVRYIVPASAIQVPIRGHEIMDAVHRSVGTFSTIVAEVKDLLRGVEAEVKAIETLQLIEEPDKRTLTIQREYCITKDR